MKFNRITKQEHYEKWSTLEMCDDCGCINANVYFELYTTYNKKDILLCENCVKDIFSRK